MMPQAGQTAPDFEGVTQNGETIRLADYAGRKVALYFYPKDDTPGCTKQACNLRDGYRQLLDEGIAVVGVSADDADSHAQFAEKYALPFPLIADVDRSIVERYGVWGEKNFYGKKSMGILRTTFLIDEEGIIRHVFKKPLVEEHTRELIEKARADS